MKCSIECSMWQRSVVAAGVLPGCGWKQVGGFIDTFHIDEKDPRVVVRIV